MPGQRGLFQPLDWPYVEGLRLDEAMHPLTILAVGLYGETMPNQNGAPIRLVVPWKYGFKSIKSVVRISLVEEQPPTSWNLQNAGEYGFYSNVNPEVDHPRWSQATERPIGERRPVRQAPADPALQRLRRAGGGPVRRHGSAPVLLRWRRPDRRPDGPHPGTCGSGPDCVYVLGMIPASWTFYLGVIDQLGADPMKVLERSLGEWALRFLIAGLAITPLRRLTGISLLRYRRAIGLLAFFYACLHLTVYLVLDQDLDLAAIWGDIVKRPFITVGMAAFLILVPLAVTSNNAVIRRLRPGVWQKIHRWVYLAAALAAVHFVMVVKAWPPSRWSMPAWWRCCSATGSRCGCGDPARRRREHRAAVPPGRWAEVAHAAQWNLRLPRTLSPLTNPGSRRTAVARQTGAQRSMPAEAVLADQSGRHDTMLIVEDEVLVRLMLAEYLRGCGYRVLEAAHAAEAIKVLEAEIAVDILFTDVQLPGELDGFGLARWTRERRPRRSASSSPPASSAPRTRRATCATRSPICANPTIRRAWSARFGGCSPAEPHQASSRAVASQKGRLSTSPRPSPWPNAPEPSGPSPGRGAQGAPAYHRIMGDEPDMIAATSGPAARGALRASAAATPRRPRPTAWCPHPAGSPPP